MTNSQQAPIEGPLLAAAPNRGACFLLAALLRGLLTVLLSVNCHSGIVVPEKAFRNTTLEELKDDAPAKTKSKPEDGAPAGFPEGKGTSTTAQPHNHTSRQDCVCARHALCWTAWQLCVPVLRPVLLPGLLLQAGST